MKRKCMVSFFAGCLLLLLTACGDQKSPAYASSQPAKADTTTEKFFPVADYLQSEIRYVDSTPLAIMKIESINNRMDTTYLKPEEFHKLASSFLAPELTEMDKNFTENSFGDKTTGYLSFTYAPKNKDQSLHRVDVVVAPGEGFDKVKSIYMESTARESDNMVGKKMYWQARQSFLVITSLQKPGKAPETRQLKVIWSNEEADQ